MLINHICTSLQGQLVESSSPSPEVGRGIAADGKGDDLDNTLFHA